LVEKKEDQAGETGQGVREPGGDVLGHAAGCRLARVLPAGLLVARVLVAGVLLVAGLAPARAAGGWRGRRGSGPRARVPAAALGRARLALGRVGGAARRRRRRGGRRGRGGRAPPGGGDLRDW